MKVTAECIPCYLNQCIKAMEQAKVPKEAQAGHLTALLTEIAELDPGLTPAENSTLILHKLVTRFEGKDLFAAAKEKSNLLALELLPKLTQMLMASTEPLFTALQFSVAGNVVDLGLFEDYDLETAVDDVLKYEFARSDYRDFLSVLNDAALVVIIGDNSGEIVFDRLLAEELLDIHKRVIYGVKGGFILNDATREDARQAGLEKILRVVDSGCNFLGTLEGRCSREFLDILRQADLIISKGQANYESLEGTSLAGDKTFFLLKAKCPVVAENLKVKNGELVFIRNHIV